METSAEKDGGSVYGGLFLTIMSDLRSSSPVWEDFTTKAIKLHSSLKSTLTAVAAFLEAFQKIADMATGSRGATKEMGSALTRLCLRHKAIEAKLKKFTGTILDHLVTPLQDCMEEWKKTVVQLDKEHAKEYKRAKQEIKKCAADTVRLQKKVKKGKADMQGRLDSAMQEVNDKYILLEEQEKKSVRTALIEERGRYCLFISCIKPFVDEEVGLLTEVTHLQEIMDGLCLQADSPDALPASSEQVILDLKGVDTSSFTFQKHPRAAMLGLQTPPSSPSSLGSRKSSMCSISSIASSGSSSTQSHSPCHSKNIQQQQAQLLGTGVRLTSVSSQDSGFTSQDTLFLRPTTPSSLNLQVQNVDNMSQGTDTPEMDSTPSTPSESYPNTPSATSTWTNWPNPPPNPASKTELGRPHTISSAYEKSHHSRPALSSQLFEPPPPGSLQKPVIEEQHDTTVTKRERPHSAVAMPYSRPSASINKMQPVLPPLGPKPKSRAVAPPQVPPIGEQPVYANLDEIRDRAEEPDTDRTPTTRDPPSVTTREPPSANGTQFKYDDGLDLTEAIRDLDNYTAALHGDYQPGDRKSKIQQNSLQLAEAIKELEASTAALESNYDHTDRHTDRQSSQSSLQCSSGYGTMNSTPAVSEDTIASGEYLDTGQQQEDIFMTDQEKYFTIPRNSHIRSMYKGPLQSRRPASTAGIPMSAQGGAMLTRRSSLNQPKPPPPVRRSSSITSSVNPAVLQKYRSSPPRQLVTSQTGPSISQQNLQSNHRRSHSASGTPAGTEPAYAELSEIQQSIQARQQQQQQQGHYPGGHGHPGLHGNNAAFSAPNTPQYAQPVTNPSHSVVASGNVVNSLNAKFAAATATSGNQQMRNSQNVSNMNTSASNSQQVSSSSQQPMNSAVGGVRGGDFPDLPPPPTDDEIREMEQIYSVPKQNVPLPPQQTANWAGHSAHTHGGASGMQQQQQHRQQAVQNPNVGGGGVEMRQNPVGGTAVRQSLISEMKAGNKFRKLSKSEEGGSEC